MIPNGRLFPIRNRRLFLFLKSFISKVFYCKTDRYDISIKVLIVNSLHFMQKLFHHENTKP
jgi:hypothetical protein